MSEYELYKEINNIILFIKKLIWKIKLMPEKEFAELLKNGNLGFEQKVYLIYFRYV